MSRNSRLGFRDALKKGDRPFIAACAARVLQYHREGRFGDLFGPSVTLVPVPGSAPLPSGALWIPLRICEELAACGLAGAVAPTVTRIKAVPKSSLQTGPNRPSLKAHYDSMDSDIFAQAAARVVLVDDVITSGCTMLAAASRAAEAYGAIPIRGFAITRALSTEELTDTIRAPCLGEVRPSRNGKAYRRP
jgi:hypothetical protein